MATRRLMFLGAPGAGKGTYASRIAPKLKIPTISTGDLIRAEVKTQSKLGQEFASYANSGSLVPHKLIMELVQKRLSEADCKEGFLLDGFPRTIQQAEDLNKFGALDLVVNIDLKEEYLMEKILGRRMCPGCGKNFNVANIKNDEEGVNMPPLLPKNGSSTTCDCGCQLEQRKDDKPQVVKERLVVYHQETQPLIGFYEKLGVLRHFVVKKGLDDLPQLEDQLAKDLKLGRSL